MAFQTTRIHFILIGCHSEYTYMNICRPGKPVTNAGAGDSPG